MPGQERGKLVYIMGPSGAGKDTLLRLLRTQLDPGRVIFARRHITRALPEGAGKSDEKHIPLSEQDFAAKEKTGFFALHWQSHGLRYGISASIEKELGRGRMVVVNGSREYLPEARRRYPALLPVLIHVPPEVLRERLLQRGREQGPALEERLQGAALPMNGPCARIDNSGPPEKALHLLLALLRNYGA